MAPQVEGGDRLLTWRPRPWTGAALGKMEAMLPMTVRFSDPLQARTMRARALALCCAAVGRLLLLVRLLAPASWLPGGLPPGPAGCRARTVP